MTVLQVIQKSTEFLTRKGVDSPRLNVELMLSQLLELPRVGLYLNFERELQMAQLDQLREWIRRRAEREPLQHILGNTNFCGYELQVNRHVLVPRPETELLAEHGWIFLNNLAKNLSTSPEATPHALDIGTGSGCIAIALAAKSPQSFITAIDISPDALAVAAGNIEKNQMTSQVRLLQSDLFQSIPKDKEFDLIISNPPYIVSSEIPTLDPEVRLHDPMIALDGGEDGLDYYRLLADQARNFLKEGGRLMVEFGDGQEKSIEKIFLNQMWIVEAIVADYNRKPRFLVAFR